MPDFIHTFIPIRVHVNGETLTLAGFPLGQHPKEPVAEQIFATVLRLLPSPRFLLVWRENAIGMAWEDNGLKYVEGSTGGPQQVCCYADGGHQLLKRYIQERLATINLSREDWQLREATDGRR